MLTIFCNSDLYPINEMGLVWRRISWCQHRVSVVSLQCASRLAVQDVSDKTLSSVVKYWRCVHPGVCICMQDSYYSTLPWVRRRDSSIWFWCFIPFDALAATDDTVQRGYSNIYASFLLVAAKRFKAFVNYVLPFLLHYVAIYFLCEWSNNTERKTYA